MQAHILRMRPVAAAAARKRTLTSAGGTGLIWETGFESATAPCEGRGRRREMRFWFRSAGPALITGCLCHVSLSIGWTPPKMIKRNQTSDIEVLLHSNLFCLFKLLFLSPFCHCCSKSHLFSSLSFKFSLTTPAVSLTLVCLTPLTYFISISGTLII